MDNRLAKQLVKTRQALREKYKRLKSDIAKSQSHLEKTYQPITQPLKELLTTISKTDNVPIKTEIKKELGKESTSPPKRFKQVRKDFYQLTPTNVEDETSYESTVMKPEYGESFFDESVSPVEISTLNEHEIYLKQFNAPLPRMYIEGKIADSENEYDDTFGVYFDPYRKKYAIGDASVDFNGPDIVINDNFTYKGTPGLYELLFKKFPTGYRPTDVDQYIDIIRRSNAHYLSYNPENGLSTSNAYKFVDIIKPRVTTLHSMTQEKKIQRGPTSSSLPRQQPRLRSGSLPTIATRSKSKKGGKLTMLDVNNKSVEYKHFDDFNELVDRLRLLISSKIAGNTGHNNEITSIIEELREARIIR